MSQDFHTESTATLLASVLVCRAFPEHSKCAKLRPRHWGPRAGSGSTGPTTKKAQVQVAGGAETARALCCGQPIAEGAECVLCGGHCGNGTDFVV